VPIAVDAQSGGSAHRPVIGKTPVKMTYSQPTSCLGQSSATGNPGSTHAQAEQNALYAWGTTYGAHGNWNSPRTGRCRATRCPAARSARRAGCRA
jgi:hypothetical protein